MMTALPSCSLLVSSCDAYSDAWPIFFHFYFKQRGRSSLKVQLLTNHGSYQDERVNTIQVGDDRSWTDGMTTALSSIDTEYVLFLQEDFLLKAPIDNDHFDEVLLQFHQQQGLTLEIDLRGKNGPDIPGRWFRESNAQNYMSGLNATLWRTDFLREIASVPGLNIWQAETRVRDCLRAGRKGMFFLKKETPPIISYVESIKGGFWKPVAIQFLRENAIEADLRTRPCPPQGKGLIAKLIRSYLKRRIRRSAPSRAGRVMQPLQIR